MLSRSFSVPKSRADRDLLGDVSMQSGEDRGDGIDADMSGEGAGIETEQADEEKGDDGNDNSEIGEDEEHPEEDDDDDDDDSGSEAEPEEEEVMVPVADILNAAFGLDNVSQGLTPGTAADLRRRTCLSRMVAIKCPRRSASPRGSKS